MTSTSTPGSITMVVMSRIANMEQVKSTTRLWIRISKRSQVLEPSPQGVLRVVIRKTLVGILAGPLTLMPLVVARLMTSRQACSTALTLVEERVILIGKVLLSADSSKPGLIFLLAATSAEDIIIVIVGTLGERGEGGENEKSPLTRANN